MKNHLSLQNKKYASIIIAFCFFLPHSTFAQSKTDAEHENFFRFGAKAGVNINKISGKAYNEGFKYYSDTSGIFYIECDGDGLCVTISMSRFFYFLGTWS